VLLAVLGGLGWWFGDYAVNYALDRGVVVLPPAEDTDWQTDRWVRVENGERHQVEFEGQGRQARRGALPPGSYVIAEPRKPGHRTVGLALSSPPWGQASSLRKVGGHWILELARGETVYLRPTYEPLPASPSRDEDRVQGTWVAVAGEQHGKPLPEHEVKKLRLTFAGKTLRASIPGRFEGEGTFTLDPTRLPGVIEVKRVEGKNRFAIVPGIYRLEGGLLKICLGDPEDAPTAFASGPDRQTIYLVLRRATAAEQPVPE
jgi:uncharacterized protein (TIGR03067 family)